MNGTLHLLPVTLGTENFNHVIPGDVIKVIRSLRHFIVEDLRSARRFLRSIDPNFPIDDTDFQILNEHTLKEDIEKLIEHLLNGTDTGLISEAGMPGIADPGSPLVLLAHKKGITVKPFTGPSSIFLALMASGLNGQNFTFLGYLPIKPNERKQAIREVENEASKGFSQIFIEAPYRNQKLLADLISTCRGETKLCIAVDITGQSEYIVTRTISEWSKALPSINKRPAVFILG